MGVKRGFGEQLGLGAFPTLSPSDDRQVSVGLSYGAGRWDGAEH